MQHLRPLSYCAPLTRDQLYKLSFCLAMRPTTQLIIVFQNEDSTDSGSETDDEAGGPDDDVTGNDLMTFISHHFAIL